MPGRFAKRCCGLGVPRLPPCMRGENARSLCAGSVGVGQGWHHHARIAAPDPGEGGMVVVKPDLSERRAYVLVGTILPPSETFLLPWDGAFLLASLDFAHDRPSFQ